MARVFCALIEIKPLDGCDLHPSKIAGATVRCYIPAENANHAIGLLEATLDEMKMKLLETEWCVDHDATEWENADCDTADSLVSDARNTGRIHFDTFHTWGHDAPDVA